MAGLPPTAAERQESLATLSVQRLTSSVQAVQKPQIETRDAEPIAAGRHHLVETIKLG